LISVNDTQAVTEPAISGSSATLTSVAEGDTGGTVTGGGLTAPQRVRAGAAVATFTHANGVEPAGDFTATVNWGITGHTADTGTVTQNGDGSYTVKATRPVFSEEVSSSNNVVVTISEDSGGASTTVNDTQAVTEPAISGSSATLTSVAEGDAAATVTVATFTHANGVEPAGDFTATVNWGITGHTADTGTVTQNGDG